MYSVSPPAIVFSALRKVANASSIARPLFASLPLFDTHQTSPPIGGTTSPPVPPVPPVPPLPPTPPPSGPILFPTLPSHAAVPTAMTKARATDGKRRAPVDLRTDALSVRLP